MSGKLEKLLNLKNEIDNLNNSFMFNMEFQDENLIIDLNEDGVWENTDHIIENSKMKGVPIHDGNDKYTIVLFVGPKNGVVDTHSHDYDEVLICLEGSFRYVKNNNEHTIIKPFESVHAKKGVPHYVELLEDTKILTFWKTK